MHDKLASILDKVADSLETKGLLKEAEELDAISNTVEALEEGLKTATFSSNRVVLTTNAEEALNFLKYQTVAVGREVAKELLKSNPVVGEKCKLDKVDQMDKPGVIKSINDFRVAVGLDPLPWFVNTESETAEEPVLRCASILDKVADSLETKGLLKEAEELDVISNTVEALEEGRIVPLRERMKGKQQVPGAAPMQAPQTPTQQSDPAVQQTKPTTMQQPTPGSNQPVPSQTQAGTPDAFKQKQRQISSQIRSQIPPFRKQGVNEPDNYYDSAKIDYERKEFNRIAEKTPGYVHPSLYRDQKSMAELSRLTLDPQEQWQRGERAVIGK